MIVIIIMFIIFDLFRTEEAAKYLEATKLQTSNGYSEEFTVMEDLMGLAIGKNHFYNLFCD